MTCRRAKRHPFAPTSVAVLGAPRRFKAAVDRGLASRRSSVAQESCPEEQVLCDFIDGALTGNSRGSVAGHLALCERCREFVALVHGEATESKYFPMPPKELLAAAAMIPQLEWQYRQRVEDLNRLFSPERLSIHADFAGLPTAVMSGPDDFLRHVALVATLFLAWTPQRGAPPLRADVLLTTRRMEIAIASARFEFTPAGVSLYKQGARVDSGASLEDILSRHVRFDEISKHQRGLRFISMFISRGGEFSEGAAALPAGPVKLSDLEALSERMRTDPSRARVEAAGILRRYCSQVASRVPYFGAKEIRRSPMASSVRSAAKMFGELGGVASI